MDTVLQIQKVSKTYKMDKKTVKKALDNVSLDLQKGEVLSLLGLNGAGKTTLSSIVASLHPPTSGDVLLKGESIYKNILSYRKKIGFCPQTPNLDKGVSLDNCLYFAGLYYGLSKNDTISKKNALMDRFSLGSYKNCFVNVLSGGYRQRFLIARTLMHGPELIILDEPTVGLDAHIRRQLWEIILELKNEGITVLLTTHYLDEAEYLSDRVCFIHHGKICSVDTPHELKNRYQKNSLEEVFLQFLQDSNEDLTKLNEE